MIGSILVFVAVWVIFTVILKVFFTKNNLILGWLLRLGMDLIEVKILHSFWNSLLFTIINSSQNNIYILLIHLFSYIFLGLTIFRYYKTYQATNIVNHQFLWRLLATLLISVSVFEKMIVFVVLSLVAVGFGMWRYRELREGVEKTAGYRFGIGFKLRAMVLSLLPWISILLISFIIFYRQEISWLASLIIVSCVGYVLIMLNIVITLLIRYYFNHPTFKNKPPSQHKMIPQQSSKRIVSQE